MSGAAAAGVSTARMTRLVRLTTELMPHPVWHMTYQPWPMRAANPASLFDQSIGRHLQRERNAELQRGGGVAIDRELEFHRLLDRQVGGPGAFQDAVGVGRRALELVDIVDAVGKKPADLDEVGQGIDRGNAMPRRLRHDALAMARGEHARHDAGAAA